MPPYSPRLESPVQRVHDKTGKPINLIRSDLRYTMDAEFLRDTERDRERLGERLVVSSDLVERCAVPATPEGGFSGSSWRMGGGFVLGSSPWSGGGIGSSPSCLVAPISSPPRRKRTRDVTVVELFSDEDDVLPATALWTGRKKRRENGRLGSDPICVGLEEEEDALLRPVPERRWGKRAKNTDLDKASVLDFSQLEKTPAVPKSGRTLSLDGRFDFGEPSSITGVQDSAMQVMTPTEMVLDGFEEWPSGLGKEYEIPDPINFFTPSIKKITGMGSTPGESGKRGTATKSDGLCGFEDGLLGSEFSVRRPKGISSLLGQAEETSSKPKLKTKARPPLDPPVIEIGEDDDSLDEEVLLPSTLRQNKSVPSSHQFSAATMALLSALESSDSGELETDSDGNPRPKKKRTKAKSKTAVVTKRDTSRASNTTSRNNTTSRTISTVSSHPSAFLGRDSPDIGAAPKRTRSRLTDEERARREAEKAAAAEARRNAKEAQAAEKKREQELASVNKLRTSKKESAPEMIVDISSDFSQSVLGQQLIGFLTNWGCEVNPSYQPTIGAEAGWKVVKWRRKCRARYDEEKNMFVPLPREEVTDEKHILVHLTAEEFVTLAYPEDPSRMSLDTHVEKIKRLASGDGVTAIYMIQGLAAYIRKTKNSVNRQFRNRVLGAMGEDISSSSSRRRRQQSVVDEDMLEDSLLRLQVVHSCLIHQTAVAVESAEWISILTSDMSTIPYKTARAVMDTSFCTDVGQVKTGVDREDTWVKMLQEIHRVTPAVANGVVAEFGSATELSRGLRQEGREVLAGVPLLATRNGAASNRNIGAALSRRIAEVFLGADMWSTDV